MPAHAMRRRDFIALVGTITAPWPLQALAQQNKLRKVGFLCLGTPDPGRFIDALRVGLRDLGYSEGVDFQLEVRSADGSALALPELAIELVALHVDVIVAFQTPAATAAKRATKDIPIVMWVADPVRQGFATSLSRPGGNLTGVDPAGESGQKALEIIREIRPSVKRIAALANATDPFREPFLAYIHTAAKQLTVEINALMLQSSDDLQSDFEELTNWGAEALIVQPSISQARIADLALHNRIIAVGPQAFVKQGGLVSYAAEPKALYRRCAAFVDKILKGANPADLPIELPTKFWLAVNLKTAKAIGIELPATLLARADEVVE